MNVCIIPARGGSTRIPGKNKRLFHGKPIVAYSIETALASGLFQHIVVSTDDVDIMRIADQYKETKAVKVHPRLAEHCLDEVGTQEVARAVLLWMMETLLAERYRKQYPAFSDLACVLYATAPLVTPGDLRYGRACLLESMKTRFAFAVGTQPLRDAGAFYWGRIDAFLESQPLVSPYSVMVPMPEHRVCDINVEGEWKEAERKYALVRHEEGNDAAGN